MLLLLDDSGFNVRQELFAQNEQGIYLDPTLSEAARTWRRNLLTYSDQFSNAVWLKQTNGTGSVPVVTANTSVAPDGTTTADTIVFDRGAGNTTDDRSVLLQSYSAVTSTVYTGSIYLKAATAGDIGKQLALRVMGTATFQVITLTADWARYSLQETAHLTGTRNIEIMNRGTFSADNTVTALVWGGQVEIGSLTDYQPITDFSTEFKAAFPTHHLYTDLNGVTPAVAPGDSVGLILDQRQGALSNLGPELWTNPVPTITNNSGTVGAYDSGTLTMTNSGSTVAGYPRFAFELGAVSGRRYRINGRLAGDLSAVGSVRLASATDAQATCSFNSSTGDFSGLVVASATSLQFLTTLTSTQSITIQSLSVREVPGNHAYQSNSGPRPALARVPFGGRRNLLQKSEEFDTATWVKAFIGITPNGEAAPDGSTLADKFTETAVTNQFFVNSANVGSTAGAGVSHTLSVYAKAAERRWIRLQIGGTGYTTTQAWFDLTDGVVGTQTGGTATITSAGNGWYRCTLTGNSTGAGTVIGYLFLSNANSVTSYAGTLGNGAWFWGAQLETGSSATNYQRVGLTTDVTEAGQPDCWALFFDGSDDFLQTNAIDFAGWTQETRRNLLTETESFNGWTLSNATLTSGISDPESGITAFTLTATASNGAVYFLFSGLSGSARNSIWIRRRTGTGVIRFYTGNAALTQQMQSEITSDWQRLSTNVTTVSGSSDRMGVLLETSGDAVDIWHPQFELGSVVTDYQRVGTDEMTVIAGVRKLSDAARAVVCELGVGDGRFVIEAPGLVLTNSFFYTSRGTASADVPATGLAAPITKVVTGLSDISSDSAVLRVDGSQVQTSASDQGSGNYSNAILYIGRRAGTSLSFNGLLHHFIARGRSTSGSKLTGAEKLTGKKSGLNI